MPTHRPPSKHKRGILEAFYNLIPREQKLLSHKIAENIEPDEVVVERVEPEDLLIPRTQLQEIRPEAQGIEVTPLERDPGLRIPIMQHDVNKRDEVRRAYLKLGPYQPKLAYPLSKFGKKNRRFDYTWFARYPWLEYSPSKDSAYFFHCFLFETDPPKQPAFTSEGFRRWCSVNSGSDCPFLTHSGNIDSGHSTAKGNSNDLNNPAQRIRLLMERKEKEDVKRNRLRLKATIECLMWLAFQQCAFIGHDESKSSRNRGNFIELLKFSATLNENVKSVVLENAPGNAKYTSPSVQKEILSIISNRVRSKIRKEIGNAKYCILVDESRDASKKEQMVIVLRYVDMYGCVQERFFDIQRFDDTCALTLKKGTTKILNYYGLEIENMRGEGT
ncbi:zinc finger MYM-type protein 1-like [Papaver somniferum]|uniref:zinc finger MYM-type protein 1-like n=1 Tax=Papaver somniferum TaxID=3469 RepID=UPI000E705615|nr:zinc finger MYM-type protein 1-like [Papaver somniferum]